MFFVDVKVLVGSARLSMAEDHEVREGDVLPRV